ncbi:MAG: M48 family metalloprotease [Mycobacteriales bacterium]
MSLHPAVVVTLLAGPALAAVAPVLSHSLPPAAATRLLTAAAVLTAAASSAVLGALAFTGLARLDAVAALGHWSVPDLISYGSASTVAGAGVLVLTATGLRAAAGRARALWTARRFCRSAGGVPGGLVVVDDDRMEAFALPGAHGRIVVSRQLLQVMTAPERRVLLAHEAAHLAHRHHAYRLVVDLAVAINPTLRSLTAAVRFATERWADEAAAGEVGDRRLVAASVARAALLTRSTAPTAVALHAASDAVLLRVSSMMRPAPRSRPLLAAAVLVLLAATLAAGADVLRDTELAFEYAIRAAAAGRNPPTR